MLNRKSNNTKLIMETWHRFMNEGTDITKQMTDMGHEAVGYNEAMNKIQINSAEDIEKLADEFHKVWMKCNSWQADSSPDMFVDYSQLSRDLKIKVLEQVELAIKIMYGENSNEHGLLQQAMQILKIVCEMMSELEIKMNELIKAL